MSDNLTIEDLKKVYLATFNARTKWKNILLILNVSSDTIDAIATRCQEIPENCYREGLKEWLNGGKGNWKDVVEALSSPIVGHSSVAKTIEKDHVLSNGTVASNPEKSEGKNRLVC